MWVDPAEIAKQGTQLEPAEDNAQIDRDEELRRDEAILHGYNITAVAARRVGHHYFAREVGAAWERRCALTGISTPSLLQACHIKPWSRGDPAESLSPHNGLLLCVHLHHLLDNFLISFDDDGTLLLDTTLEAPVRSMLLAAGNGQLRVAPTPEQQHFLRWHREQAGQRQFDRATPL